MPLKWHYKDIRITVDKKQKVCYHFCYLPYIKTTKPLLNKGFTILTAEREGFELYTYTIDNQYNICDHILIDND